jgi:hypothetical protein
MSRNAAAAIGLAILLRLALFPFAENKHGDAPMRALVAERMVIDPTSAAVPRTYCQFGPLHTTLMRPFIALDPLAPRSSRVLSLLAGIAVLFPFLAFARRLVGQRGAELATFMLAVSPLHLQASTTAASEALYLLLWVCALERLLAALESRRLWTFAVGGLLASLAAVTRYDAWLALPVAVLAAFVFETRGRRAILPGLAVFSLGAASLPIAWLAWGARVGGDPLFFAHYIMSDHAGLAAEVLGRFGPVLGRARQLGIWTLAFVGAMTLPGALAAAVALGRARRAKAGRAHARLSPAMWIVVVAALGPPALYLARGLLLQSFEPLARFALVPGALLLPLAATAVAPTPTSARRFLVATGAAAAAFSIVIWMIAAVGRDRIWAGAESMGALTRLDGEDRELARWLRAHRRPHEPVMIEPLAFADIGIAHAAGVPWTESITLIVTREPRATVADSLLSTGARYLVGYERADGTGWPQRLAGWPKDGDHDAGGTRFGRWRVLRR